MANKVGTPVKTNRFLAKMSSWIDEDAQAEESKVGTKDVKFYPLSVPMVFRLKVVAKPLLAALSDLMTTSDRLVGVTHRDVRDGPNSALVESIQTAMTPEAARYTEDRRRQAIEELVEGLLDEKNKLTFAELIFDSVREFQEDGPPTLEEKQSFIDGLKLPQAIEFMVGIIKTNKKVFAPFLTTLPEDVKTRAGKLVNLVSGGNPTDEGTQPRS